MNRDPSLFEVTAVVKKAEDLPRFLKERKPIIVSTQQKLAYFHYFVVGHPYPNPASLEALSKAHPAGRR